MAEVVSDGVTNADAIEDLTSKIRKLLKQVVAKNGHDRTLEKLEIISAGDGQLIAEMVVQPEHTNIYNTLHGGLTATLIDVCTSIAMSTHPKQGHGVSVNLNVSCMNPGKLNDRIVIEAKTIKIGKTLGFSEAIIKSKQTGQIIAKGSHTKYVQDSQRYTIPE